MKQYIVDAFAENLFEGNPAAVCVLEKWLPEELMLKIAQENNLSETAFTVKEDNHYRLRWFTPGGEIDLCGHATLATAFVLMNYIDINLETVTFDTLSGELIVNRKQFLYQIQFPSYILKPVEVTQEMIDVIGFKPLEAYMGRDLVCVLNDDETVKIVQPNLEKAKELPGLLLHITAAGREFDCVSRSFAPKLGVSEDPVCGSGHCHIAPLWAQKLSKKTLVARQASTRGGTLQCTVIQDKVELAGQAILYAISELAID